MSMYEWAENEINIVKQNNTDEYYNMCLDAALEAYKILCNQGHSGTSFSVTAGILTKLMNDKPLTPIEDTPDIWNRISHRENSYQCKRRSSLFKDIHEDGLITYHDTERCVCYEVGSDIPFYSGTVCRVIDEMYPITMPYYPEGKYKVTIEESLIDPKNGDFDTIRIIEVKQPNNLIVMIERYFTEKEHKMVEITEEEYYELLEKKV